MKFLKSNNKTVTLFLLITIVFLGGFFRFYNLYWDHGNFYHPDEITVANMITRVNIPNQMDPKFYSYNSFSVYLNRVAVQSTAWFLQDETWQTDINKILIVSRGVSAFFSTISIVLIFILAKILAGKKVALIAAFFTAFAVTLIQHAHFLVTDGMLFFFGVLIAIFCVRVYQTREKKYWLFTGLACGLAVGTKMTGIFFLMLPFFTLIISFVAHSDFNSQFWKKSLFDYIVDGINIICSTGFFFFLSSPYSLFHWDELNKALTYENGMVTGKIPVPYTIQYEDTAPIFYQLYNSLWMTGFTVPVFAFIGLIMTGIAIFKRKESAKYLSLILFAIVYFLYVSTLYTKFMRYLLPIIPILIIFASIAVVKIANIIKDKNTRVIFYIFNLLFVGIYCFAYMSVYFNEHNHITASKWIYQNIPKGSNIVAEHWDHSLPSGIRGYGEAGSYKYLEVKAYDIESEQKFIQLADVLFQGDYMIITSRRLFDSIPRKPEIYPKTIKYYENLFNEKLGYKLVKKFTSYPQIFGVQINTDIADESFQVYDHSPVWVFKNYARLSSVQLFKLLYNT